VSWELVRECRKHLGLGALQLGEPSKTGCEVDFAKLDISNPMLGPKALVAVASLHTVVPRYLIAWLGEGGDFPPLSCPVQKSNR